MKKLLLITAMFMATSVWTADYQICRDKSDDAVERCVNNWIKKGYVPIGGINAVKPSQYGDVRVYQAVYKAD